MIDPELNERVGEKIQDLLKELAEEEGFREYKMQKTSGGARGDGYMGLITSVSIVGTTASKEKKNLHVVVKSAPTSEALRKVAPFISEIYTRETYMYQRVFPAFRNFSLEQEVPEFSSYAKCYKACLEDKSEALILENLKEAGYRMWNRKVAMNHEHLSFVMKEYGRLHALSFALRDQHPDSFKEILENMDDSFLKSMNEGDVIKMFKSRAIAAMEALDPLADKHALGVFKAFVENELNDYILNLDKCVDDFSVIVHGDSWVNNMMFKYESENETTEPSKVCLIDLQISRLCPGVLDIAYFFFTAANKKSIDNYRDYLDVYYNSLSDYMRKLGSDPEKNYPRSVFEGHLQQHLKYGLIASLVLIHVMLTDTSEAVDLAEVAESGKNVLEAFEYKLSNVGDYNDRIRHNILHFVNNKLL